MQSHVDILKAAATSSGVFNTVTDDPPDELARSGFPAFAQYGRTRNPQSHSTTCYSGTADYICFIMADDVTYNWSDIDGFTDAFLTALFARSEAQAIGYEHVPPDLQYKRQSGTIKALVHEIRIRTAWQKEYV